MMLSATAILVATTGAAASGFMGGLYNALTGSFRLTAAPAVQVTAAHYLIGKGLPSEGSIAVTCVLYCESELNPGSQGVQETERGGVLNPKGAFGIASWNGVRQALLAAFAKKKGMVVGLPGDDMDAARLTQLYFVLNECANSYPLSWNAIRSAASAEAIIATFVADYENPKDHQAEINKAKGFVPALRAELAKIPPPVAPPVVISAPPVQSAPQTGPTPMFPIATLIQIFAPIVESIVTGVLNAHGIKTPGVAAPPPPIVVAPPAAPAATPAAPAIDPAALEAIITQILSKLNVKT